MEYPFNIKKNSQNAKLTAMCQFIFICWIRNSLHSKYRGCLNTSYFIISILNGRKVPAIVLGFVWKCNILSYTCLSWNYFSLRLTESGDIVTKWWNLLDFIIILIRYHNTQKTEMHLCRHWTHYIFHWMSASTRWFQCKM